MGGIGWAVWKDDYRNNRLSVVKVITDYTEYMVLVNDFKIIVWED